MENGEATREVRKVLDKWETEYKNLFSFEPTAGEYDELFYQNIVAQNNTDNNIPPLEGLNHDMLEDEVVEALRNLKAK